MIVWLVTIEIGVFRIEVGITILAGLIFCMKISLLRLLLIFLIVFQPYRTLIPILL